MYAILTLHDAESSVQYLFVHCHKKFKHKI